jgi:chemotaxis signal transduction protein
MEDEAQSGTWSSSEDAVAVHSSVFLNTMRQFYPVWLGSQRFAIPASIVRGIERVREYGAPTTALHTRWGRIPLCDLAALINPPPRDLDFRYALLILFNNEWIGITVDKVDDMVSLADDVLSLPTLIHDAILDPTVSGVILLDDTPCLVLDLEAFAVTYWLVSQANFMIP